MDGGYNEGPVWTAPCTSGNQVVGGALKLLGFGYSDEGNAPNSASCTQQPPPAACTFNGQSVAHGATVTAYQSSTVPSDQQCVSQQRTCANGSLSGTYQYAACSVSPAQSCTFNGQTLQSGSSVTAYLSSSVPYGQTCTSQTRACTNGTLSGSYTYGACSVGGAASCTLDNINVAHNASQIFYSSKTVPWGSLCSAVSQSRTCANGTLSGSASYQYGACAPGSANSCTFNNQSVAHGSSVTAYQAATVSFGSQCVSQSRLCSNGNLSGTYQHAACVAGTAASCTWNGQSIAHNAIVTAYQASSVPFGQSCLSQVRTCTNGTLSGTHQYPSCSANAPTSCTFNGASVTYGATVTAYQSSSVSAASQCVSEQRACTNGALSGLYTNASCSVAGSGGGGGGSPFISATTTATTTIASTTGATPTDKTAALRAQIAQLLALIAQLKGGTASIPTPTQPTPTQPTVTINSKCPVIPVLSRAARKAMTSPRFKVFFDQYEGFPNPTGFFGAMTEAALKQWQSEHKLSHQALRDDRLRQYRTEDEGGDSSMQIIIKIC